MLGLFLCLKMFFKIIEMVNGIWKVVIANFKIVNTTLKIVDATHKIAFAILKGSEDNSTETQALSSPINHGNVNVILEMFEPKCFKETMKCVLGSRIGRPHRKAKQSSQATDYDQIATSGFHHKRKYLTGKLRVTPKIDLHDSSCYLNRSIDQQGALTDATIVYQYVKP